MVLCSSVVQPVAIVCRVGAAEYSITDMRDACAPAIWAYDAAWQATVSVEKLHGYASAPYQLTAITAVVPMGKEYERIVAGDSKAPNVPVHPTCAIYHGRSDDV